MKESWRVDPDDPRAPPQEVWDRMTPEEREYVVASLPSSGAHQDHLRRRIAELIEARDAAARQAAAEARRAEALAAEVAELRAELERLKGR